jgi:hypothetical protein
MTLTGELNGDPGDLPGMYNKSIGQFRDTLIGLIDVQNNGREWLTEYSRHAAAVSSILDGHYAFFEDSNPADPGKIREHIIAEMNALWKLHDILVVDLSLYDSKSFREVMAGCTGQIGVVIENQLNSIRRNVKQKLADGVRAAWLDLSDKRASSKRMVKSRAAALRRLRDVAQGWFTLSEELETAASLWQQKDSA